MSEHRRWIAPTSILTGVVLLGAGIAGMLRVSYNQHPSWTAVIVPPIAMIVGCVFLLAPLLSRLSREAAADDDIAPSGTGQGHSPEAR